MKLNHPNIIRVYHFEIPNKSEPFLIMDYIDGRPLSEVLEHDGPMSLERTVTIFSQVCDALAHAHESGVIHRDIKPSNIILCANIDGSETAKIVDFGIAKFADTDEDGAQNITKTGEVFGSPLYMSPEQCAAKRLDARSDIYSTACVIFESLTGQPPILGGSALETMHKHVFDSPSSLTKLNPDLPRGSQIEAILLKALSKHPDHRYQSIADLRAELADLIDTAQSASIMDDAKTRFEFHKRQKKAQEQKPKAPSWVVPVLIISALSIGASALFLYNQILHPPQPTRTFSKQ
jgi:serine/threonine-protein kinase